jgi:Fe-S-cluster containining protein
MGVIIMYNILKLLHLLFCAFLSTWERVLCNIYSSRMRLFYLIPMELQ